MSAFMRASLATITVVGIAGVALRLSGLWERRKRILKRAEQLIDDYGEERTLY